jgi:hypothetical protein
MDLRILNPSEHPDWDAELLHYGDYSFFHTSAWALVLAKTYGFRPLYFAMIEADRPALLMPIMEVGNILTGKRGVSLPFSDQCPPLGDNKEVLRAAMQSAIEYGEKNNWRYIEWRDSCYFADGVSPWKSYGIHNIDLVEAEAGLFARLSPSNQRNIKKAMREGVTVTIDRSPESLRAFYRLHLVTRKRHGLPPQPFSFFQNIFEYIIAQGHGVVVLAYHDRRSIAAAVFFHFGKKAIFKYGASESKYSSLRPNNLVMWEALKWYGKEGIQTLSLGRTDVENLGLLRYKRAWGAKESILKYFRYDIRNKALASGRPGSPVLYRKVFSRMPIAVLRLIGRFLYRFAG